MDALPEFFDDVSKETIQTLIETFDAKLVRAQNDTHFVGVLDFRVQYGEDKFIKLPAVNIIHVEHKANLERARATMFAEYLINYQAKHGTEWMSKLAKKVGQYEGDTFIGWVRIDYKWKMEQRGLSA
jgi:hypothetical protein